MKLWLLSQDENGGYDTHDSCVVAAETEYEAIRINPSENYEWNDKTRAWHYSYGDKEKARYADNWASDIKNVTAEYLGTTDRQIPKGVILASFNAG